MFQARVALTASSRRKVFDRLDREVHPVEIVKELAVHPDGFVARCIEPVCHGAARGYGGSRELGNWWAMGSGI